MADCKISEKALELQYEELLFGKVMALYAEKESEKIEKEIEEGKYPFKKTKEDFEKLNKKYKRKKTKAAAVFLLKKAAVFAAAFIIVVAVSLASVVVVPAEMQNSFRKVFAPFFYEATNEAVDIGNVILSDFIDPELYVVENALVPTWLPEGYELSDYTYRIHGICVTYIYEEKKLDILEYSYSENMNYSLDFDEGDILKEIKTDDFEGVFIEKADETENTLFLRNGKTDIIIYAQESEETMMKIVENMRELPESYSESLLKTAADKYYSEFSGAYAPAYIPKEFSFKDGMTSKSGITVIYSDGDKRTITINESYEKPIFPFEEADADFYKKEETAKFIYEYASYGPINCVRIRAKNIWMLIYGTSDMDTMKIIAKNMAPVK